MAQNSAGITLSYGTTAAIAKAKTNLIPGITSVPDIGGEPEMLETTTLDNLKYTSYIAGLQDLGGSFQFEAYMSTAFKTAVDASIAAQVSGGTAQDQYWTVTFPAPLSLNFTWKGKSQQLGISGVGVNEVIPTSVYITVEDTESSGLGWGTVAAAG